MKVLLIGVGGVGESLAAIAKDVDPNSEWLEKMILTDYNIARATEVSKRLGEERFPAEQINAKNLDDIVAMVKKHNVDMIMNAVDPLFNEVIFDAAFEAGVNYMDCAMTLSKAHPEKPYELSHIKLGDYQFNKAKQWEEKGLLAIVGSGVEPGMSDVFARYAEKHLFDEIHELNVRDGDNYQVEGKDIAFGFSIWTTIEECLNPPVIWEKDKGWFTTEPFSEPETFVFPEGIGPVEVVNVEHEEVLLMPRYIDCKRVTFKFGLGEDFIQCLKYLRALNMDRKDMKVKIGDAEITPRDFLGKAAPNPLEIGKIMTGKGCAGTWVTGLKEGMKRSVYLYQVADNQECLEKYGTQSVVAQTAFNPVLMMELMAKGIWKGAGVHGAENFDPDPFVERMSSYGFPAGLMEMDSEYKSKKEAAEVVKPIIA